MTRALIDETLDQDSVTRSASATLGRQVSRLVVALILVAAVGYLGFRLSGPTPVPPDSAQKPLSPAEVQAKQGLTLDFDNPLGGGREMPVQVANALLKKYGVELGLTGPVSPEHVTASWVDDDGQVGIELDTGILLIYSPDDRTPDQYADAAAELIALGGWEGTIIPLRGVRAKAGEKSEFWSAVLVWKEGEVRVEMYGDGGQLLAELVPVAEEMRHNVR